MALSAQGKRPVFLVIAGPNGSGKSSAYEKITPGSPDADDRKDPTIGTFEFRRHKIAIRNPDLMAKSIFLDEGLNRRDANLAAVRRIEEWLDLQIDTGKDVAVETVLSTGKYRRLVEKAQKHGYDFWLLFVALDSVETNIRRVALRVKKGGHEVPEADIRARYSRTINEQLPWFLDAADEAWIMDNSGTQPVEWARKEEQVISMQGEGLPDVAAALRSYFT